MSDENRVHIEPAGLGAEERQTSAEGSGAFTPPCRACGSAEWVACYRPEYPERAICVECCPTAEHHDGETGHVWTYDRSGWGRICDHCGQSASNTDYYDHGDQPCADAFGTGPDAQPSAVRAA